MAELIVESRPINLPRRGWFSRPLPLDLVRYDSGRVAVLWMWEKFREELASIPAQPTTLGSEDSLSS